MSDDVFIGQIVQWELAVIPENWHICDGTDGTPDMREMFAKGKYDESDTDLTGGSSSHSHGSGNSASGGSLHNHGSVNLSLPSAGGSSRVAVSTQRSYGEHTHTATVTTDDGGSAHEHGISLGFASALPPYYKLYYIMKVA